MYSISKVIIPLFICLTFTALTSPARSIEKKCSYTPSQLGIILQKHPDEPQYDFSKPADNKEPVILQGSVSTKITQVEFEQAGSYTVEVASGLKIVDKKRKKLIPIEVAYPKDPGVYPIIVFSHGCIASGRDYRPLAAYWASHGYVSITPTHDDALTMHIKPGQKVSVFKLLKLSHTDSKSLVQKGKDISCVLDSISNLPDKIEGIKGKLDKEKIAVIGHHSGATACQLISGVKYKNKKETLPQDPRIDAAIYFFGINWRLPSPKRLDWANNKTPTMLISFSDGIKDISRLRQQTRSTMSQADSQDIYFATINSTRLKKPPRKQIRKMIKSSNIRLITWRPFQRAKKRRQERRKSEQSNFKVSDADHDEMPGSQVMDLLGVTPIGVPSDRAERFKFAMSFTVPFLNAYLKDNQKDLDYLQTGDEKKYGDHVTVKLNPLNKSQP